MDGMKTSSKGKLGLIMAAAPVVLELLVKARQKQRGRYATARKRDRIIDTLLSRAQKVVGKPGRRRFF